MPNCVHNNGLTFILSQTWTHHYPPSWITDQAVVSVTPRFPCRTLLKSMITPTLLHETQVLLLLTTALPVLIKCLFHDKQSTKTRQDLKLSTEINDGCQKLLIYWCYKNVSWYELFFHRIAIYRYTDCISHP